jgi:hypothetical protein
MAFSQLTESDAHLVLAWSGLGDVQAPVLQMANDLKINHRVDNYQTGSFTKAIC